MKITALFVLIAILITACGGGSSDSGGGSADKAAPETSGVYPGSGMVHGRRSALIAFCHCC